MKLRWTKPLEIPQRWAIPISILKKASRTPWLVNGTRGFSYVSSSSLGEKSPVTSISLCGSCCANASGHGDDALRNATATSMRRAKGSVEQAWADFLWGDGILSASLYSYLVVIWTILHCQARNWWQIGCDFFDLTSEICSKARKAPARTLPGSTFLAETVKWSSI